MADFKIERNLVKKGVRNIAGIDEAGRGALIGPVVAVSLMFPPEILMKRRSGWILEIDDSKNLSESKRKYLAKKIFFNASSLGIGIASHKEIDRDNIYQASLNAMKRAVIDMEEKPDFLMIDGFLLKDIKCPQMKVIKGDKKSTLIAAASIMAKVLRDQVMINIDKDYNGYGLKQHKGYATKVHYAALARLGPTILHRKSFRLK